MAKETDFLKKRAEEFFQRAKEDFEKQRFNLTVFDIEQAVQLWIKHLIFAKAQDFPKTHYFDILIKNLSEVYNNKKIEEFYKNHILEFKVLEEAYITTRYLPKDFAKDETIKIIKFLEKFFKFLEKTLNEKFI